MVLVTPPPMAVIVMGYVPVFVDDETDRLKCTEPDPGAAMLAGLKLVVMPDGTPVAENEIAALNEPESVTVTVEYPLWPQ